MENLAVFKPFTPLGVPIGTQHHNFVNIWRISTELLSWKLSCLPSYVLLFMKNQHDKWVTTALWSDKTLSNVRAYNAWNIHP